MLFKLTFVLCALLPHCRLHNIPQKLFESHGQLWVAGSIRRPTALHFVDRATDSLHAMTQALHVFLQHLHSQLDLCGCAAELFTGGPVLRRLLPIPECRSEDANSLPPFQTWHTV